MNWAAAITLTLAAGLGTQAALRRAGHPAAPEQDPRAPAAARPCRPAAVTMIVHPCGCVYSFTLAGRERCPPHAAADQVRDDMRRWDQEVQERLT